MYIPAGEMLSASRELTNTGLKWKVISTTESIIDVTFLGVCFCIVCSSPCQTHSFVAKYIHLLPNTFICCQTHSFVAKYIHLLPNTFICCQIHLFVAKYIYLLPNTFIRCQIHLFVAKRHIDFMLTFLFL